MATRCTIQIDGVNYAKVYKHWDGYPSNMLKWLTEFNRDFNTNRGNDAEYKFAQLLRSSVRDEGKYALDDNEYTGWGVFPIDADLGQDYEYVLHGNGSVSVLEV